MNSLNFTVTDIPSPSYVVDETLLRMNLELLNKVAARAGCKILLAQKAFSTYATYPMIGEYLDGTTASGLFEAKLAHLHMGKENHIFSPAYSEGEMDEVLEICDTVVFNSLSQWDKFKAKARQSGKKIGLRINPEFSTQKTPLYDPCAPYSRLGITAGQLENADLEGISGFHFHTLCEQDADALAATLKAVESKFAPYLDRLQWVNMGGGHHITKPGYNMELLVATIQGFRQKYKAEVYLEPGEAVALNAGFLVGSVLDILHNGKNIAILDISPTCHMPDVLEMPYRPQIIGASTPGEYRNDYLLAGPTCLAGDVIGEYSFQRPLQEGDRVVFTDMAIYTMVKNNMFNGVNLPSIVLADLAGRCRVIREFGYEDFTSRL